MLNVDLAGRRASTTIVRGRRGRCSPRSASPAHLWLAICLRSAVDVAALRRRRRRAGRPAAGRPRRAARLCDAVDLASASRRRWPRIAPSRTERDQQVHRRAGARSRRSASRPAGGSRRAARRPAGAPRRVHAGDLHVAAERDRADPVLGLAASARRAAAGRTARSARPASRPPWPRRSGPSSCRTISAAKPAKARNQLTRAARCSTSSPRAARASASAS